MARAIWKGLISFGLVNIPVELHTAARDHTPRFRLLHRKDLSPISMERVCQKDGKPVAWADLVKGYEVQPGEFVTVTEDDFKTAALEKTRRIDMRERQHLAALMPLDGRLLVSTIRFPEDLVELPAAPARSRLSAQELRLAAQLIEGMSQPWRPEQYSDDYVKALMGVIEAKAEGDVVRPRLPKPAARTKVVDLVARLQESLAAARKPAGKRAAERNSTAASRTRATRARRRTRAA